MKQCLREGDFYSSNLSVMLESKYGHRVRAKEVKFLSKVKEKFGSKAIVLTRDSW